MIKRAIIAGASGLIGQNLLDILLQHPGYDEVLILVRKELPVKHHKLNQLIVDFDKPDSYSKAVTGGVLFSCLGSTKKKTPDPAVYRKIDHDYTLQLAQIALRNNISQFHVVSSMGANPDSIHFYTKLKGETETELVKLGLRSLYIYRPGFLTGKRKERRPMEGFLTLVMKLIDPLLLGGLKKYRSIPAKTVAEAMYKQSLKNEPGVHIYASDKIKELS